MLCGCDTGVKADDVEADAAPHPEYHVLVWTDPGSGLPEQDILDGCNLWAPLGVGCERAESAYASDVQIYADKDGCPKDPDGSYVLAYARCCGPVVFIRECFRQENGQLDAKAIRVVTAHEVGHQFGLWWHVPKSCTPGAPNHPDGGQVCGTAVMNPFFNEALKTLQEPDFRAFDIRDKEHSVVDDENHHAPDAGPGMHDFTCVYRTEARP